MQPISKNNPNLHKGPSSSLEFNQIRNDLNYDLASLFMIANEHDKEIRDNMDILIRENYFLQNKLNKMEETLEKIKTDLIYKENGMDKQQLIQSFYDLEHVGTGDLNTALIDTLYGVAMIRESDRLSKTAYVSEDGARVIPQSLVVSVMETNNTVPIQKETGNQTYTIVDDLDTLKMFDGSNNSVWVRTSSFDEDTNVSEVRGILHVKLPMDIMNNAHCNTITLNPYPEFSMTIADIWYKGYGDTWYRLPTFPTAKDADNKEVPVPFKDSGKLIFTFPKMEVTEIQVFYSQPYWFMNAGKREFVYGFQEVGVEYRAYNTAKAEFVTAFSIEGTGKRFYTIDQPQATPSQGSEKNVQDLIEYKLYYDSGLTNEFDFGSEILAPVQKVYIKTVLTKQGEVVPTVKNIKVDYLYKDLSDL